MKIDCALLCDAATVREGLLHILGGGVTRGARPQYPSPLGMVLALRLDVHPTETDATKVHVLEARLQGEDGAQAAKFETSFTLPPELGTDLVPGEHLSLPLVVPVESVPIAAPGGYSFEVLIDSNHQVSVPFLMTVTPQPDGM